MNDHKTNIHGRKGWVDFYFFWKVINCLVQDFFQSLSSPRLISARFIDTEKFWLISLPKEKRRQTLEETVSQYFSVLMNLAEITPRLAPERSKVKQYLIRIDRTIVEQLEPGCKLKVDIKKWKKKFLHFNFLQPYFFRDC